MGLDLVDSRDCVDFRQQLFEAADVEVGKADGFYFAGLKQLLHCFVRRYVVDVGELEHTLFVEREELVAGFECTVLCE